MTTAEMSLRPLAGGPRAINDGACEQHYDDTPLTTGRQPAKDGLPYGFWRCSSGRVVIFDRHYCPLWQRRRGGIVRRADPTEFVEGVVEQVWFYHDGTPAKGLRQRLEQILADFRETGRLP